MKEQEVIEGNKLIAEFMGFEFKDKTEYSEEVKCPTEELYNMPSYNCYYHSDWNWLMPVVEKIEEMGYLVNINRWVAIYTSEDGDAKKIISLYQRNIPKIEMTWLAIIKFIKWYNK